MSTLARSVTGGVDTHLDVHVVAALDERGTLLGVEAFETTRLGYKKLLAWLEDFGPVALVGIEGSSSYGAGLTRHLHVQGIAVVEVDRPNRQRRRRKGKSDSEDAISAARAAFSGDACGAAKTQDPGVDHLREPHALSLPSRGAGRRFTDAKRATLSLTPRFVTEPV